jgi:phage terminase small subunit
MTARKSGPTKQTSKTPRRPKQTPAAPHARSDGKDKPAGPAHRATASRTSARPAAKKAPKTTTAAASPSATGGAAASSLSPNEELFITEYLRNGMNGTAAWIAVNPGTPPALAGHYAYRLVKKGHVASRIAAERERIAKRHEITRDQLLAEFLAIASADPNELMQMRAVACASCWGGQERSRQWTEPDPECQSCHGEGNARLWIADTRKLSPAGRALYAGIHQTKGGIKVLMHDKVAALVNAGKIIGAFEADNSQKNLSAVDAVREFLGAIHNARLPIVRQPAPAKPEGGKS